jgi:hypothetical protein
MNGGSLKRHDTVAKGPWVWGLCSLDSGPGVGGANVSAYSVWYMRLVRILLAYMLHVSVHRVPTQ